MSRVNPRRVLPASVLKAEQCVAPADTFARLSPYDGLVDPPPPIALISVIHQATNRVELITERLNDRIKDVLKPYPKAGIKPSIPSAGSLARSELEDLHAAISRLNDTIDAIDL